MDLNVCCDYKLSPAFLKNNIPIVLVSSDYYIPYTSVLIKSILIHSRESNNYDFIIFSSSVSEQNMEILRNMAKEYPNCSIRMFDPSSFFDGVKVHLNGTTSIEAYYRMLTPYILTEYKKVICMDCDIVAKADIAELYREDVEGFLLGAVGDTVYHGFLNGAHPATIKYCKTEFPMKDPFSYINTGVLLINLQEFRDAYSLGETLIHAQKKYPIQEQDAINVMTEGRVKFLDIAWNFFIASQQTVRKGIEFAPAEEREAYYAAEKAPKLIHYANKTKPWNDLECIMGYEFWEVSRTTPFYEIALTRLVKEVLSKTVSSPFVAKEATGHVISAGCEVSKQWVLEQISEAQKTASFKSKAKHRLVMPVVNIFLPKGSKRRCIVKAAYFKIRGWAY